jgi:hypothetical protein
VTRRRTFSDWTLSGADFEDAGFMSVDGRGGLLRRRQRRAQGPEQPEQLHSSTRCGAVRRGVRCGTRVVIGKGTSQRGGPDLHLLFSTSWQKDADIAEGGGAEFSRFPLLATGEGESQPAGGPRLRVHESQTEARETSFLRRDHGQHH